MKIINKILSAFAVIVLIVMSVSVPASAAGSLVITPNGGASADMTKPVTVNIKLSTDEEIMNVEAVFHYDESKLQFVSAGGDYAQPQGNGNIKIFDDAFKSTDRKASYSLTFKAVALGSASISFNGNYYNAVPVGVPISYGAQFNIVDPTTSNANLSSLSVSSGSLSPSFSSGKTNYNVTVRNDVSELKITAKSAVAAAKVEGATTIQLVEGNNTHNITVTAIDGSKKVYTLNIKRMTMEEQIAADTPPVDILATNINGQPHHILDVLPETAVAPEGFSNGVAQYNGAEIQVYESADKTYVLYTIKNDTDETLELYTYNAMKDEFIKLPYFNLNGKMYIFADAGHDYVAPAGYDETQLNLGNSTIKAYTSTDEKLFDFYIIRCYVNGEYRYYRYDMAEQTIQRAPEFSLVNLNELEVKNEEKIGFIDRFIGMSVAGKVVIITVAVAVLCILALIIIIIVRFASNHSKYEGGAFFEPEVYFDEVKTTDSQAGSDDAEDSADEVQPSEAKTTQAEE